MPDVRSTIASIVEGQNDANGKKIERVYTRISDAYAIYRTEQGVVVQFADDPALGSQQRKAIAPLSPLRGEINGLIDGWRTSSDPLYAGRARRFDRLVAGALEMGLQGDVASAQAALLAVKTEIIDLRTSVARTRYVVVAAATTAVLVLVFTILSSSLFAHFPDYDVGANPFWTAAAIGAIGAWFSIAVAIRSRAIQTDLQTRDNDVDAILRVTIGAISAIVLLALLKIGTVNLSLGGTAVSLAAGSGLIVAAFVAGFAERLVSDFLSQSVANALQARGNAAAAGGGGLPPPKPAAAGADEMHPLGQPTPPTPPAPAPPANGDGDDADACGEQGLNVQPADQTPDTALPAATGGVAGQ